MEDRTIKGFVEDRTVREEKHMNILNRSLGIVAIYLLALA